MKHIVFILLFLVCWKTNFAQNEVELVPQVPHQNMNVKLVANTKINMMVSSQGSRLKYWDLKTGLLIKNGETPKNQNGHHITDVGNAILWTNGIFCIPDGYGEESRFVGEKATLKHLTTLDNNEIILFADNQVKYSREKYSTKIFVKNLQTNEIIAEKDIEIYGKTILNNDFEKYLIIKQNDTIINFLNAKTLAFSHKINCNLIPKKAFLSKKNDFLFLYNDQEISVFDLSFKTPKYIQSIKIPAGTDNLQVSEDFPLLFYANLDSWGVIDFKENKVFVEEKSGYKNAFSQNGVFIPTQKALFQFRNGQLGIFYINKKEWKAIGTKFNENENIKFNFPKLFLENMLASPQNKAILFQQMLGTKNFGFRTSSYMDNQNYKTYLFTPPNKMSYYGEITDYSTLKIFNPQTNEIEFETALPIKEEKQLHDVKNEYILIGKDKTSYSDIAYQLINFKTKKIIATFDTPTSTNNNDEFRLVNLSENGNFAVFLSSSFSERLEKKAQLRDTKSNKMIFSTKINYFATTTTDEKYFIYDTEGLSSSHSFEVYDIAQKKVVKTIICATELKGEYIWSNYIDKKTNQLLLGTYNGNLFIWDLKDGKFVRKINALEAIITNIYTDKKYIYVQGGAEIKIFDKNTGKPYIGILARLVDYTLLETIFFLEDGYYMMDKNMMSFVAFSIKNKTYTFDQFDLQYNRPDIVLERVGFSSKELIESYRKAYEKRLRKLNFDPKNFEKDKSFNVPELQLKNQENYFKDVKEAIYPLTFEAKDALFNLDRLNLYINGVPIFGMKGKDLRAKNTKTYNETIALELSSGKNVIEISVLNEKGVESLKEKLEINFIVENTQKPVLHLVTIGVSEYQNAQMNLKYATKDGKDLADLLQMQVQKQKDVFQSVKYHALFDKDATKENILNLKKELQKTNINDVVMVFVSGHGLLDKDLDYFLATNNVDFANPKAKGLPYDELENLLDGIPARQKILMMDACHSGEIDKEEIALVAKNEAISNDKNIKFKNFDKKTVTNKNVGLQNSFELSKQMFTDLRKGSGTTVLSAAGGVQLAQESSEWQNGAFTYCVLSGLKNMKADLNKDGKIMLSELQNYLFTEVPRITGGLQQPTSRIENLVNDFRFW